MIARCWGVTSPDLWLPQTSSQLQSQLPGHHQVPGPVVNTGVWAATKLSTEEISACCPMLAKYSDINIIACQLWLMSGSKVKLYSFRNLYVYSEIIFPILSQMIFSFLSSVECNVSILVKWSLKRSLRYLSTITSQCRGGGGQSLVADQSYDDCHQSCVSLSYCHKLPARPWCRNAVQVGNLMTEENISNMGARK